MEVVAFTFAILGFTFGVIAVSQVNQLKKEVQRLKNRLEGE